MHPFGIVIPVRNGASRLPALVEALNNVLPDYPGEIVLVDDGSSDGTWNVIVSLAGNSAVSGLAVQGIRMDGRHGQQTALLAGMSRCRGRCIVTMDDDLAHPAEFVGALLEALEGPADLVYAQPPRRPGNLIRRLFSRLHQYHLALMTGSRLSVRVGSFRAISPALTDRILDGPAAFPYLSAMALGLRPVPRVVMLPSPAWHPAGGGRFSFGRLLKLECSLALHHGPAARRLRRRRDGDGATTAEAVEALIAGETGP